MYVTATITKSVGGGWYTEDHELIEDVAAFLADLPEGTKIEIAAPDEES
jgi:hypothetical protein